MNVCICHDNVMHMNCPAHQWYFNRMREPLPVCDNALADMIFEDDRRETFRRIPNRKIRRKDRQRERH